MMKKMTSFVAVALCAIGLFAAPAIAGGVDADDDYTPLVVDVVVNPDGSLTLSGDNCPPNTTVEYVIRRGAASSFRQPAAPIGNTPIVDQGSGQADENGDFEIVTAVLSKGRFNITVTCGDKTATLSVNTARSSDLATTGSNNSIPLVRLGMILVAIGGIAVYAAKKRQGRRAAFVNA
ncbi:hypothetical protein [Actinospongicola halichondriae]|uniref:hypothetical protein n=1 Tax=Actinospongicola halichondriae TaxID=3236844 RepID=UPI003D3C0AC6